MLHEWTSVCGVNGFVYVARMDLYMLHELVCICGVHGFDIEKSRLHHRGNLMIGSGW